MNRMSQYKWVFEQEGLPQTILWSGHPFKTFLLVYTKAYSGKKKLFSSTVKARKNICKWEIIFETLLTDIVSCFKDPMW